VVDAAVVVTLLMLDERPVPVAPGEVTGDLGQALDIDEPVLPAPLAAAEVDAAGPRAAAAAPPALIPVVHFAVLMERGLLPGGTAGQEVGIGLGRGAWSLRSGFAGLHSKTAVAHGRRVRVDLWEARLLGCRSAGVAIACVGGEAGILGVDAPLQHHEGGGRVWGLSADLGAGLPLSPVFRGFVMVSAHLAMRKPRVQFDDGDLVHEPGLLGLRLAVGLDVSIT
jgi:hypothetical protein